MLGDARALFALDPAVTYVNHGGYGATPRVVLEAQARWRAELERAPAPFLEGLGEPLDAALAPVARLLGARVDDLVFVENATAAINAVLGSMPLGPGDEVVTTSHVYPAYRAALAWYAARAGFAVVEAPVPFPIPGPDVVVDAVAAAIGPRARLVIVEHVTSASGLVFPVGRLVGLCRAAGVPVFVDGAHALGMLPVDLGALQPDFWTGNAHKWLFAPKGCAVLYARPEHRSWLRPPVISYRVGDGWRPAFHWTGTRDPTAWLCLSDAVAFAEGLGLAAIQAHNDALCARMATRLAAAWGVEPPSPPELRRALATLPAPVPEGEARALSDRLWREHRVVVPVFPHAGRAWIRIAAQIYNDEADYDRLAAAVAG